jgi:hypothetical protein
MRSLYFFIAVTAMPVFVEAQTGRTGENTSISSIIVTILPILVVAAVVYFLFIRERGREQKTAERVIERQEQHWARVEQTLERIANALEKHK